MPATNRYWTAKQRGTKRYQIYKRDGFRCLCCGEDDPKELTLDHIVPQCEGKNNSAKNLQTLCRECNRLKGDDTFDYRRAAAE